MRNSKTKVVYKYFNGVTSGFNGLYYDCNENSEFGKYE
jgi:hypothetical protein